MNMPDESHNNIENTLKAYAKQRRAAAGEPLDMPSHTRAVLQREIAQRAAGARPAPQRWLERLVALWPRLAVGAAAMTAAAIAMVVLTDISKKAKPPVELAKAEPQVQAFGHLTRGGLETDPAATSGMKLADNRGLAEAQSKAAGSVGLVVDEKLKETDKLQTAATVTMAKVEMARAAPARVNQQVAAMTAAPAPAEKPPAAAAPGAPAVMPAPADVSKAELADTTRVVTAGVSNMAPLSQRLRFAQIVGDQEVEPAKRSSEPQPQPQPPAVLASFQLEQVGDRVVITDTDGSIYEGQIQLASASQQQVALERRTSRARRAPTRAPAPRQVMTQAGEFVWRERDATVSRRLESGSTGQQLFFTATGTNRSVNQRVVVNGVLSSPADGTLAYGAVAGGGRMTFDSIPVGKMASAAAPATSAVSDSNAVTTKGGQLVLPAATATGPVPAMPQASAQIEGTLRVGNAPETELNAVGVGP
ncbi:MAG: hypothetical protein HZA88_00190 [Verrucomicrobia bacterium]|nr:hypothetical protein [Verrucomicrobiota bacterium]